MTQAQNRSTSLTNGLINRVRLLGVLVGVAITGLLVVSLLYAFQNSQASVVTVARDAAKLLDLYLSNIETDLIRVGRTLPLANEANRTAVLRNVLDTYGAVFQISVVNNDGEIVVDRRRVGSSQTGVLVNQPWHPQTTDGQTYLSAVDYSEFGVPTVTIGVPVVADDLVTGTLVARLELTALWSLIVSIRAGDNGYAYLVDDLGQLLAYRDFSAVRENRTLSDLTGQAPARLAQSESLFLNNIHSGLAGSWVLSSGVKLGEIGWYAIVEVPIIEPIQDVLPFAILMLVVIAIALYVVVNITRYTNHRIVNPLNLLRTGVAQIQKGDLSQTIPLVGNDGDEIQVLTTTLNDVVQQLNTLINSLEERVAIRTRDLEVASDVSSKLTSLLDLDQLLAQIVELIRQSFGFEQVSILLYEDGTRTLNLQSTSGSASTALMAEVLTLSIDEPGMIPRAAAARQIMVVNDVGQPSDYVPHPALPTIQSELVIPLQLGEHLIGVLDIESNVKNRFGTDELKALKPLAQQIAVAVENARLYDRQQQLIKDLRVADQVKSQFLASMSHELRTPLNAILNFTRFNLMGIYGTLADRQRDSMEKIVGSAEHLLSLINDVLDIAKIEASMMQLFLEDDVDLANELATVVASGEALLANKPVKLVTDIDSNLPIMVGDRRRIRQIILNLVSNACKFTEKGTVTVSAKWRGDTVDFAVLDTGPGIAADKVDIIFEPFHQTELGITHSGGTGLGLPIAKRLVEAHYGRLWVETAPGEGSVFHVSLPIRAPQLVDLMPLKTVVANV